MSAGELKEAGEELKEDTFQFNLARTSAHLSSGAAAEHEAESRNAGRRLPMSSPASHPVFIHCRQGKDRPGLVVAVYRMEVEGWSPEGAIAEMQAYGFHGIWYRLEEYVLNYSLSERNTRYQGLSG